MGTFSSFTLAFFGCLVTGPVPRGVALPPPYPCDADWYYYNENCYKFLYPYQPWYPAGMDCYYQESVLVSILSKPEAETVAELTRKQNPPRTSDVWIGLSDHTLTGNWSWVDGSPFIYKAWGPGQPDYLYHTCVAVTYSSGYLKWDNRDCSLPLPYVCKKRAWVAYP